MQTFKKTLCLPGILAITALSLIGCGQEDSSAAHDTTNEAINTSSMNTTMESAEETIQVVKESVIEEANQVVEETKEVAMEKVEQTKEAVTEQTQEAVDTANEAVDEKVNDSMDNLMNKLGQ